MAMKVNKELPSPAELKKAYRLPDPLEKIKKQRDVEIREVFTGHSDKFIVLVGPCSADNEEAVCEYVVRLAAVNEKVSDKLLLIPRIYTNKPRTTGEGYKGGCTSLSPTRRRIFSVALSPYERCTSAPLRKAASPQPTRCSIRKTAVTWMICSPTRLSAHAPWKISSTA